MGCIHQQTLSPWRVGFSSFSTRRCVLGASRIFYSEVKSVSVRTVGLLGSRLGCLIASIGRFVRLASRSTLGIFQAVPVIRRNFGHIYSFS